MIDFHSHILPGVDDGADSIQTSLEMLELFKAQGVNTVVATSHFYEKNELLDDFLDRRKKSYEELYSACQKHEGVLPNIILGAEVALTPDTAKMDGLEKLCLGNTNTILIELPYGDTSDWIAYAIYEIIARRRLVPVLAHFERFCTDKNAFKMFEKLLSIEVFIQVNADSLLDRYYYKIVKKLVKKAHIDVLGSDAHSLGNRKSNYDKAVIKISRKFGEDYFLRMQNNAKKLLKLN